MELIGGDDLISKYSKYENAKWLGPLMNDLVNFALSKIPKYPSSRPSSSYRRTGDLGRSIAGEVKLLGAEYVGTIGTKIEYAKWVIDEDNQAHMHKGIWWTLQGALKDMNSALVDFLTSRISNYLE